MGCSLSSATFNDESEDLPIGNIPRRYKPLEILGKGGCGVVFKCKDTKTKQNVAIKLSTTCLSLKNEITILKVLNKNTSEDSFVKILRAPWPHKYMVMELLDMNFREYVDLYAPLRLQEIRIIIQQLAVALKSLRANRIIHADFKLTNIMLEDDISRSPKVKIIDFGLAISDDDAAEVLIGQNYLYRAPEIIFKIPFSAAVDIWSLGCVMATMIFGAPMFPGNAVYDQLYYMTMLLGPAPQHILLASTETCKYFKLTNRGWVLKLPTNGKKKCLDQRAYTITKLNEENIRLEPDNHAEAEEREQCTALLMSMLKWDEKDRITPQDILKHPFITKSFLKTNHYHEAHNEEDPWCNPSPSHSVHEDTGKSVLSPHRCKFCSEASFASRRLDRSGQSSLLSLESFQSADECLPKADPEM